jgi:ribosomal-protein-alanine N-acetyltransferase
MRTLAGEGGVTLEPQTTAHAAELYAILDDPELYAFTDAKGPASLAALTDRLRRLESRTSPDGREQWLNWVVRGGEGAVVGYVQATVRSGGEAEIAYVFGRAHWGRGFATRACDAMLEALAVDYAVTRATATLDPQNTASLALLRRLGFSLVSSDGAANEVTYARELIRQ